MTNYLVSVIVPVYKVEKYIHQCIDSIINQSYRNLEIILIDDGSPDNCPQICDDYKQKDDRIRVIHKDNGGLSSARNAGLDICTGDYIAFVDSDDMVQNNFIEVMLEKSINNSADICICDFLKFCDNDQIIEQNTSGDDIVLTKELAQEKMLKKNAIEFIVMWNKLFKRYIFDALRFPQGRINEDESVIHYVYSECKTNIIKISEPLYCYRFNDASIMNTKFSISRLDCLIAFKDRMEFYQKTNQQRLYELSQIKYLYSLKRMYLLTYKNIDDNNQYLKTIISDYRKTYRDSKSNKSISFLNRLKFLSFYMFPNVFGLIIRKDWI